MLASPILLKLSSIHDYHKPPSPTSAVFSAEFSSLQTRSVPISVAFSDQRRRRSMEACNVYVTSHMAPVSDREYKATLPETANLIDLAANMIKEGRAEELMPREADSSAPTSAYSEMHEELRAW